MINFHSNVRMIEERNKERNQWTTGKTWIAKNSLMLMYVWVRERESGSGSANLWGGKNEWNQKWYREWVKYHEFTIWND